MHNLEFRAMNTDIMLAAEGDAREVAAGFERARQFIADGERRLTRFDESSELSALNRAAGESFTASPVLYEIVKLAQSFAVETRGLFEPAVLDALEAVGYDRSMDELRAHGAGAPRPLVYAMPQGIRLAQLDDAARTIRLPADTRLDLGGIAKGWIAERAAQELAEYSDACAVNAGGDLFAIGCPAGSDGWEIEIEDPREPGETLALLRLPSGAVATSSVMRRRWQQGERARHHLIDPRTRLPAETDWLSVTVIAPHAAEAEVMAKVLLIAGSGEAARIAGRVPGLAFIAVAPDGQLHGTPPAREFLCN